ncbi:LysR family transcriptional regulator substrate-binding protein [Glutamicibacter sp. PS]|uniref:LysR family transcriptional regulator substrate-binding protein n=1 Tax=Glutamicibacter sp. PS TaxID=3075634 RepID=UPI0028430F10|nr:LysR family transcriptional regulator substrate-binding protein [Glutamicibacter sp. PS]MDR4534878.1 LysR family transcriptional regulator substrate-binding protein [Glutamicibacter sp. PS]
MLRIFYTAGVTPGKWLTRFAERYPQIELHAERYDADNILSLLGDDLADAVFLRFVPGQSPKDDTRHVIPLYEELEVVCAARDHDVEYYDESIPAAELEQYPQLDLADFPPEAGGVDAAMELVATGAFIARMPMSLARLFGRKDVISREIEGGEPSMIGICWPVDSPVAEALEEFIGVVRGRGASSSRQASVRQAQQQQSKPAARPAKRGGGPARGGSQRPRRQGKGPKKRR